ncbi:MAG: hypothetical protein PGN21_15315 [Sphingomonas paucimobilis]
MFDGYSLPPKKARTSRWMGMLFLLIAAVMGVGTIVGAAAPGIYWNCDSEQRCTGGTDATNMLPDETRLMLNRDPEARGKFLAWMAKPGAHAGLAALILLEFVPMMILLFSVGMALRRLGERKRNALTLTLPWLRRASRAAIALAVARLIVPVPTAILLYQGVNQDDIVLPRIDLSNTLVLLLLTVAVHAVIWALEAGIRAERELADFV